mgnify:CR=1 FL=1
MTFKYSLKAIQQRMAQDLLPGNGNEVTVRRLWWAALETLQHDILLPMNLSQGLWIAAPLPALYEPRLLNRLQGWVWAPEELNSLYTPQSSFLLPSRTRAYAQKTIVPGNEHFRRIPLRKKDGRDPLLIIITPEIQVALGLHGNDGSRQLVMRSDPETIADLLMILDARIKDEVNVEAIELGKALEGLGQIESNQGIEKLFWPRLAERLAVMAPSLHLQAMPDKEIKSDSTTHVAAELSLLEALTHEVRTPLATIRTLIRSLLRRDDLSDLVESRLKNIDNECTEQIDRFGLIFNAAELQRQPKETSRLAKTDLGAMLKLMYPVICSQLERRGVQLLMDIASDLPEVLSDPERLELMLGGLVDRTGRGLPSGGSLTLKLRPAGNRLKLQILSEIPNSQLQGIESQEQNAELGPVLSWNPNTGSLQLTKAATQRLLASLGGRLADRRDSGLTVFFPVAEVN